MRNRWLVALAAVLLSACSPGTEAATRQPAPPAILNPVAAAHQPTVRTNIGFRSRKQLDEHFAKHGREFGGLSKEKYLRAAQELRDAAVGGSVEEIVRRDGTSSRFDRKTGAFLAFNRDGTIRTFFKPNDGENYFRRQAQRSH